MVINGVLSGGFDFLKVMSQPGLGGPWAVLAEERACLKLPEQGDQHNIGICCSVAGREFRKRDKDRKRKMVV
jgi:hypothetical protein